MILVSKKSHYCHPSYLLLLLLLYTIIILQLELSHHLAHAYSTATQSPFDSGMVVVMDGMGETYRSMLRAERTKDPTYVSDLSFGEDSFDCIPSDLAEQSEISYFDFREAESVYVFEKKEHTMDLRPVFKRFTPENSPPSLYNHGFENMDSVGALYSRASSHIFGDWNACGKVMGLAPWMVSSWKNDGETLEPKEEEKRVMWGTLYSEEEGKEFQQDKNVIAGMPLIARMDSDLFDEQGNLIKQRRYDFDDDEGDGSSSSDDGEGPTKRLPTKVALDAITLAHRIQIDLEDIAMDFVKHFKEKTGEENLCIAGGVGLNSVLNGRLSRELGFANTYISPYPGDDGIAVGCCAYALFGNEVLDEKKASSDAPRPPVWKTPLSPYLGPDPTEVAIKAAIEEAAPWLEVDAVRDDDTRLDMMAQEIESGGVVAWYHGRSELGPRALGHRSILADPRKKGLVRFINEQVKKRESFRPFAPSALVEHADDWFDLGDYGVDSNKSPYMTLTAMVHEDKRSRIPAVTHVDGSSRLQTVTPEAEPLYHKLITKFFELTGVPMVLNTSFNTLPSEPIVESPKNAIRSFLCSMGSIEMLVMGDYTIKRKQANLKSLLGEMNEAGDTMMIEPVCPKRTGPATFETTFEAEDGAMEEESVETKTRVRMPSRPMQHEKGAWFEVLDELEGELLSICDGTNTMNDILAQYTAMDDDEEMSKERVEDTQLLLQNIVHRLVRLYEHGLISW
jgi:carbamoyltransferase